MADIFISYSSYDRTKAEQLVSQLETAGYSVWIDQHGIGGALNWSAEIVGAFSGVTTVAFLLSAHSLSSENVAREIHLASEKKKNILPIILEDTPLPRIFEYPLAGLQRVRYERIEDILHAVELLKQGHSILEQMQAPTSRISDDGYIHLAVLPFDDLSPQHDNEWFADGMMDELIGTLGALEKMRVPSRTDVLYYRTHKPKAKEIAKDLGVRYLVEGSVRKSGEKIRITATLIDTQASHQIWTNRFDGTFDDIFDFQDKVSREITEALKLKLTPAEVQKITADPTQNVEAYELYLRGQESQRLITRNGYEKALQLYEEAIKLDPKYVDAMLSAASTCCVYYRECSRDLKWLERANHYLAQAEVITGETSRTLWIRGEILWVNGEYEQAEKTLLKAIELEPGSPILYNILGNLYTRTQAYDKAVIAFRKALELHEDTNSYYNIIAALIETNQLSELKDVALKAIPFYHKELQKYPNNRITKLSLCAALIHSGDPTEVESILEPLTEDKETDGFIIFNIGVLYDDLDLPDKTIDMFHLAIDRGFREVEAFRAFQFKSQKHQHRLEDIIKKIESQILLEKQ